jgi:predicted CxxxxCH...CXXCH cytochrome family protein
MVGCGAQKPAPAAKGEGTAKGVAGQYFYVNLFTPPVGGIVTSSVGGIACGASSLGTPVADAQGVLQHAPVYFSGANSCGVQGQTQFPWTQTVTLTAAPQGTNAFIAWAGDCAGSAPTCTLSAGADKTVVAIFGPPGSGHATPFPNRDHAPAYFRFLANDPTAPRCTNCHGQDYGGQSIAPSCNACHASAGWANWQQSCSFCHGLVNDTTKGGYDFALHPEWAAPPYDVSGRVNGANGPAVGAHQAHVATNAIRAPLACSECHVVPTTAIHTLNNSIDIQFGPLSRSGQAHPTWNPGMLTCSATYCHGNFSYGSVQGTAAPRSWGETLTGCTSCHGMPPTGHIPVGSTAASCSGCHPDTVLPSGSIDLVKGRHVNGVKDMTGGACDSCHWFPYPSAVPPPVPFAATGAHLAHYGLVAQGTTGYGDLDTLEMKFPTPPPPTSGYAFGCGNCHPSVAAEHSMLGGGATAKVVLFESNLAPALKSRNAPTASFGAGTCSGVYCHGNAAATPAWNASSALACNACHGTVADPSGAPAGDSHVLHPYTCNTCHAGTTANGTAIANTALHVNGRPDLTPGGGETFTYTGGGSCSNISCHFGGSATWGTTASGHLATLGSGDVVVFTPDSTHDITPLSITESCTLCHAPSLVTQHASKCDLCHQGANPAAPLIGTWNKTCTASGCHAAVHGSGPATNHDGMYWNSSASCALCHDTSGSAFPGPGDNCSRCHNPSFTAAAVGDHQPPTTTSNAASNYTGTASIHLTATDAGTAGVSVTWYSLDAGRWTLGTDISVGAPLTGSRAHSLQFYSVDHGRNAEAVQTVGFTVQAALPVAPSAPTGISALAGSAQATITWTAGTGSTSSLIRYGTTSGSYPTTIDPAASPRTISSLTNGTAIYYQVGAKNLAGTTWSAEYTVTPMLSPPSAPTGISAAAGNSQATITWTAGTGSTSSLIRYGTTSGSYPTTIDPAASPRTISSLTNGTAIYYQVGAKNLAGTTWSAEYTVTPVQSLPLAPTGISAAPGNSQATITWTAGIGSASSVVRYGTTAGGYTTTIDPATSPQTISSLTNGTAIYYQVGAKNLAGTTWAPESSATPAAASSGSFTFSASGTFTIPAGVTSLTIDALGGGGEGGSPDFAGTGANGGSASVTYGPMVVVAGGGYGGECAFNTSGNGLGGAGGVATCGGSSACSALLPTNGSPGAAGWDDGQGGGFGGAGGSPNGMNGADAVEDFLGGSGGGGGGARIQGPLTVTPGGTATIVIGSGSSVTLSW